MLGKLDFLMDQLQVPRDRRNRPYRTIVALNAGRDAMAHANSEAIRRVQRPNAPIPRATIYRLADPEFFDRARKDVRALAVILSERGEPEATVLRGDPMDRSVTILVTNTLALASAGRREGRESDRLTTVDAGRRRVQSLPKLDVAGWSSTLLARSPVRQVSSQSPPEQDINGELIDGHL